MINQISFFDVIPQEDIDYPDWHELTLEQIASIIGEQIGVCFKPDPRSPDSTRYVGYKGKVEEYDLNIGHYTVDMDKDGQPYIQKGQAFIGIGYWNKKALQGCGIPCKDIKEAVEHSRAAERSAENTLTYRQYLTETETAPDEETDEEVETEMEI